MTKRSSGSELIHSWDTYWHGARDSAAFTGGGSGHPAVLAFWDDFFRAVRDRYDAPRIIDIASGNGAVVESARAAFDGKLPAFTCVDISQAAATMLAGRFPGVEAIVADAANIPLESATFDIATSQFGIEYAGESAIWEMARLVGETAELALLLHHAGGQIQRHCETNRRAIRRLQDVRFIPLAGAMFAAAFAARDGGDRAVFASAAKAFTPAIREAEAIMLESGRDVADQTIVRLYRDVRTINERLVHYDASEVTQWLERMSDEVDAYAGRMASMCDAAIDEAGFKAICDGLRDRGFDVTRSDALTAGSDDSPLAWALTAVRGRGR